MTDMGTPLPGASRSRSLIGSEKIGLWRELAVVSAIVTSIGLILWWRFLPLPHGDLGFYTEPAYLLAKFGTLAGPGSQYVDLTYQKGAYSYPPGHYLLLAGWIKLFGLSPDSLLAYTHLVHTGILILLYALLRFRYGCTRLVSSLALLSVFARMPHGRPDLPACLLSVAAWLALPEERNWKRIVLSGLLAGATLLVSPAFGVGILATLFVLIMVNRDISLKDKLRWIVPWGMAASLVFVGITGLVLWWQHSWTLAYVQFTTNMTVRGSQVNQFPSLILYVYLFGILPFAILAVLPAVVVGAVTLRQPGSKLRDVTFAFLGGAFVWFKLNKAQLLLDHHFLYVGKSVFLAVLCSQPKVPTWLRVLPFLIISTLSFYLYKSNYLYIAKPLRAEAAKFDSMRPNGRELAADSLYFVKAYQPGHTLSYETIKVEEFWPQYLAAIPPQLRESLLFGLQRTPAAPDSYVISAYATLLYGDPAQTNISCTKEKRGFEPLRVLGRNWKLPENPFALKTCTVEKQ